ncbi:MAG TPA: ABC transporter permease [Acidimicrobiales bacterium]|jgi:osmoprotectant transport system permease protein
MHFLSQVVTFFTTASNWSGPDGILIRFAHQAELSAAVVVAAGVCGVGLGAFLGHTGRAGFLAVNAANAARAVPSLALLTLLAIQPSIGLRGNGFLASFLALFALAVPPILTNTYIGVRDVDPDVRSAAKGIGMTGGQILWRVEAPLSVPLVMAGVRTAAIEVVATATLAAYVSFSDLGTYVVAGLNTQDNVEAFSGAVLVAILAFGTDLVLAVTQRAVTPSGLRTSARALRSRGVAADASTVRLTRRAGAVLG